MSEVCGMQRSTSGGELEPRCSNPVIYAVTIEFGDGEGPINYGLCPDHAAWVRSSLAGVTRVRQAAL